MKEGLGDIISELKAKYETGKKELFDKYFEIISYDHNSDLPKKKPIDTHLSETADIFHLNDNASDKEEEMQKGYIEPVVSREEKYQKLDELQSSLYQCEEEIISTLRDSLKSILSNFDRLSVSDGSWPDSIDCEGLRPEFKRRRINETYCNDELGIKITLDYISPEDKPPYLDISAYKFPEGVSVIRPNWWDSEEPCYRQDDPKGEKVDPWEILEGLVK